PAALGWSSFRDLGDGACDRCIIKGGVQNSTSKKFGFLRTDFWQTVYLLLTELAVNRIKHPKELRENIQLPQIEVINACQFMDLVTAIYSEYRHKKHNANDVLNRIRHANVLLIDDLGKQRNTPAVSSELFTLLNYRHEENLTTVWTANINPEEIVSGMTSDFAAPLAGRLRECSHIINVTEPKL
ncbi:MAG: DnaA ATPase domain-containing protein, partial [Akkermansiaceae bacterium]